MNRFHEGLRPYQIIGAERIARDPRVWLLDPPGMGKTAQWIRGCDIAEKQRLLVFCKGIARRNWEKEINEWGLRKRDLQIIEGLSNRLSNTASIIINYDVANAYASKLSAQTFDAAAIDEGQDLKNPDAQRTIAIYGQHGALAGSRRRTLITGSPVLNHYGELWTHMMAFFTARELAACGIPTSYTAFLHEFCLIADRGYGPQPVSSRNPQKLAKFMKLHALRRDESGNLPPLRFENVRLPPSNLIELLAVENRFDLAGYRALINLNGLDPVVADRQIMDALTKDLGNPEFRRLTGLAKIEPVAALVSDEIKMGLDKIILFCVHRRVIEGLHAALTPQGAVMVYGGMTDAYKQDALDQFRYRPEVHTLIAQIDMVSTSVTITCACEGMAVEPSWVPDINLQAAKRMHRIGQMRPVRMRFPSLAGSIDEALTRTLMRKTRDLAPLLGEIR